MRAQSSILFNCRKEPITGLRVGLINVFLKFPIILLPTYYTLQEKRRKLVDRLRTKSDLKKYPDPNATIWIAYVNKDIIKLNRLPKFDLSLLKRPEDELVGVKIASKQSRPIIPEPSTLSGTPGDNLTSLNCRLCPGNSGSGRRNPTREEKLQERAEKAASQV